MKTTDVRAANRAAILRVIRRAGSDGISTADVATSTNLSIRSVQEILRELRASGLVEWLRMGVSIDASIPY